MALSIRIDGVIGRRGAGHIFIRPEKHSQKIMFVSLVLRRILALTLCPNSSSPILRHRVPAQLWITFEFGGVF